MAAVKANLQMGLARLGLQAPPQPPVIPPSRVRPLRPTDIMSPQGAELRADLHPETQSVGPREAEEPPA